ncbi:TetR/AcrR family transcriptional regulator, partial [Phytoactinopolyspora endophytica]|uniref:TetR/AcrR family transcriptional regulator n=1 Tax=Phytoactinopolyspora endophytica TaxID=1642495 RepID=UPI00197BB947
MTTKQERRTQADRRAQSRNAILEAAAQGISQNGYARLSLEDVARQAGYSRGALYHQFSGKEDLALAVVEWVDQTWEDQVGHVLTQGGDPAEKLLTLARLHAIYCRRDVAAVLQVLRV